MTSDGRKLKFLIAGSLGFFVDAGCLALLTQVGKVDPYVSRILSIAVALLTTWLFNRHITFGAGRFGVAQEAVRYGSVGIAGSVINYILYSGMIAMIPHLEPLIALAIASVLVMVLSWFGYSRLVFVR